MRLPARATVTVRAAGGGRVAVRGGRPRAAVLAGTVRLVPARRGSVAWGERAPRSDQRYRGELRAVPSGGGLDLVNAVGLEDYLKGVVPREMPADWGDDAPAALRVQAIAARSYALATMKPTAVYDLFDDDRSQTYGGIASEDPRSTRAVASTRNTVLTYGGKVITAYFFSTSGGRTENVENVFTGSPPRPYLVSVPDPYDRASPYHASWPDPPSFTAAGLGPDPGPGRAGGHGGGPQPRRVAARPAGAHHRALGAQRRGQRHRAALDARPARHLVPGDRARDAARRGRAPGRLAREPHGPPRRPRRGPRRGRPRRRRRPGRRPPATRSCRSPR